MTRYRNHTERLSPRWTIVGLVALAITIFFTLPRMSFLRRVQQTQTDLELPWLDLAFRAFYVFMMALLFFHLHLNVRKIRVAHITIHFDRWYRRAVLYIVVLVVMNIVLLRLHRAFFDPYLDDRLFRALFTGSNILVMVLALLAASIYRLVVTNHEAAMNNEILQRKEAEARYNAIKNQLNPHYLFNTFNTLTSLITSDRQAALHLVSDMSDVYRHVLKVSTENLTTVGEELAFVASYIGVLAHRYGEKLIVSVDVDDRTRARRIPPMALQMLVENAVKHNVVSKKKPLHIRVFAPESEVIVVSNTLQKRREPGASTGVGLYNLNERCRYITGREIIVHETDDTFSVSVPLVDHEDTDR